ncbi:hypothetical protein IG631_13222 [Alternaria alternata]|nr:hypothetical protein IG631_13222 [Alternaria alternata]
MAKTTPKPGCGNRPVQSNVYKGATTVDNRSDDEGVLLGIRTRETQDKRRQHASDPTNSPQLATAGVKPVKV